jgi:16S rRNA (guanine527-N7)-methyltransferase
MADVSRETCPPPDAVVAAAVVGPGAVPVLEKYAGWLATDGVTRGLIGPREVPRLWDRHLLNCALLAPLVRENASVVDLGSGAGLPGLVLAIVRPDLRVTLVEPMARRVAFLEEVRAALELANVDVVRERAEQWRDPPSFDVVTARALAPLSRLLRWAMPRVAQGGEVLALKGSSAGDEVADAAAELRRWKARAEVTTRSAGGTSPITVVRVVSDGGPGIGWPSANARGARAGRRRGRG